MKIIYIAVDFEGYEVRISDGKVFLPQYGTTLDKRSHHGSFIEVPINELNPTLKMELQEAGLL